jgi:2-oxoglutarate ferredoxin oxidoreductase subunit delta
MNSPELPKAATTAPLNRDQVSGAKEDYLPPKGAVLEVTGMDRNTPAELQRFRPKTEENNKIRITRFNGLCKSCGECVLKCPVNAISWHNKDLGMLGEPGIYIDLDKCIGCETCERVCPDSAIKITNKRLTSARWSKGFLGWLVRSNAKWIELAVTTFSAPKSRLKKFGKSKEKTLIAKIVRSILMYDETPIVKQYDEAE